MTTQVAPDVEPKTPCSERHPLDVFFAPETVAIFGATETPDRVGRALMANLIRHPFGGTLFPIHPKRASVLGVRAYPHLAAVGRPIDLAIIATPAPTVPDILQDCIAAEIKGAIILSAGFGEGDPGGAELERQIRQRLQQGAIRILGPNCLGIASPRTGLNATFAPAMVPAGNVGFLSQSGALLTALLHKDSSERIGCSAFVSVGSLLDVSWAEWIDYLGADPYSECIGIYLEKLDDAPSFFAAVRRVAPHKPVILIKGREAEAETATAGARDEVFEEACRCNGILQVHRLADLFRMAAILPTQPTPKGRRLTILTNARGPGLLAAEALRADGGKLTPLAPETVTRLSEVLTKRWNRQNPIDVGDDADLNRFAGAAAIALGDPNTDALLVLLAPHATIDPVRAADQLRPLAGRKPILACWLWGASNPKSLEILQEAGIATLRSPEAAIRAFGLLRRHGENLGWLSELSAVRSEAPERPTSKDHVAQVLSRARRSGRTVLTETEHHQLLSAYDLPIRETRVAGSEPEAVEQAEALGYPVVLGLAAEAGPPPSEAEETRLKAFDAASVRRAFQVLELIARAYVPAEPSFRVKIQPLIQPSGYEIGLKSTLHRELGPVIQLGVGGRWATLARDRVVALPPLRPPMIRQMIEESPLFTALRAAHEREPLDFEALVQFLTRFSQLVVEQRGIKEVTINPLLVSPERVLALDALVVLHDSSIPEDQLPKPALAPFALRTRAREH
jgi:acetyltransferase